MAKERVSVVIDAEEHVSEAAKSARQAIQSVEKETDTSSKKAGVSWTNLAAKLLIVREALEKLGQVAQSVGNLVRESAQNEQVERSFRSLAASVGESADKIIAKMRQAAASTISDSDLRQIAARAAAFKIPMDKMTDLMEIARASAAAMGRTVSESFDDIVTGIARGSPMILDNLGLTIKLGDANEALAKKLGKTVSELTEAEKSQAVLNATIEAGDSLIQRMGGSLDSLSSAEKLGKLKASFENMKDSAIKTFAPIGGKIAEALGGALDSVAKWLDANAPNIYAVFSELPNIMRVVGETVVAILRKTFRLENFLDLISRLGAGFLSVFKTAFESIIQLWRITVDGFRDILTNVDFNEILAGKLRAFQDKNTRGFFKLLGIEDSADMGWVARGLIQQAGPDSMRAFPLAFPGQVADTSGIAGAGTVVTQGEKLSEKLEDLGSKLVDALADGAKRVGAELGSTATSVGDLYRDELGGAAALLKTIMERGRGNWQAYEAASTAAVDAQLAVANASATLTKWFGVATEELTAFNSDNEWQQFGDGLDQARKAMSKFSSELTAFNSDSEWAQLGGGFQKASGPRMDGLQLTEFGSESEMAAASALPAIMGQVGQAFLGMLQSITSVKLLMDPLATILQATAEIIGPLIDEALAPLVGILVVVGQLIGTLLVPVIAALAPVIEVVSQAFVWLYNNIIRPVGQMIYAVFVGLGNFLATIINAIISVLQFVGLAKNAQKFEMQTVDPSVLPEISVDSLRTAGGNAISNAGSSSYTSGSTTTVEHQPDINIYLTVEGSVYGSGGPAEVGREMGRALEAYAGIGGRINIQGALT